MDDAALKSAMLVRARELGFADARVTSAELPVQPGAAYQDWLAAGHQGEMAYMERLSPERTSGVEHILPGARSVIVLACSYYHPAGEGEVSPGAQGTVRVARYALGKDYHYVLKERLAGLVAWLEGERPGHRWRVCVDSAPVLERAYAVEAGLGFIGKNAMVISWLGGSFTFLAEVLTTAIIEPDVARPGTCGNCTRCIDACPTGAIVSPGVVDARRCISYLTIEKRSELTAGEVEATGEWAFGCDVCQDVCPYNKAPEVSGVGEFAPGTVVGLAEPVETFLVPESNRQFERRFAGSPILRAGKRKVQGLLDQKRTKN